MKINRFVLLFGAILSAATAALAVPNSKSTYTSRALRTDQEFAQVKAGDRIALVCKQCDSVTVQTVQSKDEMMELCKEGHTVTCPSCHTAVKAVRHGPPGKSTTSAAVTYVNDKGEECIFVAKLAN